MTSSLFCSCNENPDFCGSHEENLFCPKCSTSSFHCSDLFHHIEIFCSGPAANDVMKASADAKDDDVTALEHKCYKNLMKFSSLEKLVRILSIHNYITQQTKSANLAHIVAYMLCNPNFIQTVRNFKPTEVEMYNAFLMLVKTSQTLHPPSSKYFKPQLKDSILVASLRFDDSKAEEILGVRHLPLISSKDVDLVKLLFLKGHILETGPFNLHLNKGGTLSRMKQGIFATVIPHARKIIKPHLKHCVKCLRTAKELQTFSPPLGNPRFFSLLENSSPIFLGISMDMVGPTKFLLKRGSRGKHSVTKGYILVIVCVLSKFITFQLMEDCKRQDLDLAVSTHIANYRPPKFILTDAAESNNLLASHQKSILEILQTKVRLEILQSSHQFLNLCESQIRIFKSMLRSNHCGIPSTAPLNTRSEINCILSHICNILNSRPLSLQDENKLVLNANLLTKPFLSQPDQELLMNRFLEEIFNEQDNKEIFTKIFKNNNEIAQSALILLKREFLNNKNMFMDKKSGLKPLKGDIVIIAKEDPRLGLIIDVISQHRVMVRFKNRGVNKEDIYHPKILGLIFRPETPSHFLAISSQGPAKLNPLLSQFWDKLSRAIRHGDKDPGRADSAPA